ncbi:phytanoyl-CoA dioxygenase family protein [Oryzobacter telluris]|uniref:phytanoyl-CoA dioxygenase family protein n=1 Tax=Oryzobacter telluris TaxID=3149179 RepID=UPI00370DAB41
MSPTAPATPPDELTDEQVAAYHRYGYLAVPAIAGPDEVIALQDIYDELFGSGSAVPDADRFELAGSGGEELLPQIVNPHLYAPSLLETGAYERACRFAIQLLGDGAAPAGTHAIRKPARHGAETPWHQDEAYWAPDQRHYALSIWVPLQEATVGNGCMQFLPGSHRAGVAPHRLITQDAHGLVLSNPVDTGEAVVCELGPGGATIHDSQTIHYTGPNTSDQPRRALIMAFGQPAEPMANPRHFPWRRSDW